MFFTLNLPLPLNLLSLGVVGEPGLLILTTVAVVALTEVGYILFSVPPPPPPPPVGGSSPSSGGGADPNPDDDGGWGWKTKLLVGVGLTLGTLMLGSYWGWSDPLYFVKHPVLFGGAVADRAGSFIPGLTFGPGEVRPYLVEKFPAVWAQTTSMDEFLRKTLEAEVNPWNLDKLARRLTELGAHPEPIFRAVEAAYPGGASAATLEHALQVAATDFIDTIILEYAEDYWE